MSTKRMLVLGLAIVLTACSATGTGGAAPTGSSAPASAVSSGPAPAASGPRASAPSTPITAPTASSSGPPTPRPSASSPGTATPRPNRPQELQLHPGETAHLTYFDVTLQRQAHGKDALSEGWRVSVCYTHPHGGQDKDGTTRVSRDPWSVQVRDGEGASAAQWVPVQHFPADEGWSPLFRETRLAVGECETGWISIRHGSPDLVFQGLRYHSSDFGDTVTWTR